MPAVSRMTLPQTEVVFHQLDDINALGDALASAAQADDVEALTTLRASLERYTVGMGWHATAALPAILAYLDKHSAFEEDLFAPALVLQAIAPMAPETAALLARLPETVRALLALVQ